MIRNYGLGRQSDLMLVKIDPPIDFIDPVRINLDPDIPCANEPLNLTVMGYGISDVSGADTDDLLYALVEVVPFEDCRRMYSNRIQSKTICAWDDSPQGPLRASCRGDSGTS